MLFLISPLQKINRTSFFSGMGYGNIIMLAFRSFLFKICTKKIYPSDRHILWHCKGHTGSIWNLVSPYGNNSCLTVLIDKWRETFLHMRISYLRNKTREIPNLSDDHCAHPVTDTEW